jgi:hypothetical protein
MLRKLLVGVACVLSAVACTKTIDGVLTNSEALTFNVKNKSVSIPAGRWETTVKIPGKKEVKLVITTQNNQKTEVSFKVLSSAPLPQENGTFELLAADSGQPYNVNGSVKTTHVDSETQWQTESCMYQVQRQECYHTPQGNECHWVTYDVQGFREVEFFMRDTTQVVEFNLMNVDKSTPGEFSGTDQHSERIYKYQSACR